jgi:hypothetical protein
MMSATDMRGLSEPNGSWNTICISRRSGRMALKLNPSISRPRKTIGPCDEISRSQRQPQRGLARAGFADHAERLALAHLASSMPSTAFTWSTVLRSKPCLIGNQTLTSELRHHRRREASGCGGPALRLGGEQMRCV